MSRITADRPGVLLRELSDVATEVDLDACRSAATFHDALVRVHAALRPVPAQVFNRTPPWWHRPGGDSAVGSRRDVVCPDAGAVRCMHRLVVAARDVPSAAARLQESGYSVVVMEALEPVPPREPRNDPPQGHPQDSRPPGPVTEDVVPDHPPLTLPEVEPDARCDRCGHRAYVTTAHDDADRRLSWCHHHFHEHIARHDPYVVADSRHRLTTREDRQ